MTNNITNNALASVDAAKIRVVHGANEGVFCIAGAMVSTARLSLVDAFNIPSDAIAFVNGLQVDPTYKLMPNNTLEFVKKLGEKGGRYPGGKAKLANEIAPRLERHLSHDIQYREPFFGWGAIGLRLLRTNQLSSIWINDKHPGVASYWTSVIRYPKLLIQFVQNFVPTRLDFFLFKDEMLSRLSQPVPTNRNHLIQLGFKKLVLHRLSYSGLGEMAGGPLSDICSRWNPDALCKEIIEDHRDLSKVNIYEDCCTCLNFAKMIGGDNLLYLDPPYYIQGPKCYSIAFAHQDHEKLAHLLRQRTSPWLLSYDDCPEIRALYEWAFVETVPVNYSIAGANRKKELLIGPRKR